MSLLVPATPLDSLRRVSKFQLNPEPGIPHGFISHACRAAGHPRPTRRPHAMRCACCLSGLVLRLVPRRHAPKCPLACTHMHACLPRALFLQFTRPPFARCIAAGCPLQSQGRPSMGMRQRALRRIGWQRGPWPASGSRPAPQRRPVSEHGKE